MSIGLFQPSWGQCQCLNRLEPIFIIPHQFIQRVVSPGVDFVDGDADGVLIADLHGLDGVAFFPGIFVEGDVVLDPGVGGIGEMEGGEYLEIE